MQTTVANKYALADGWQRDPQFVYIGRGSMFGNPFKDESRDENIARFKRYFDQHLLQDERFVEALEGLRGKTLVCFCKPRACHGDIIANYLNRSGA